MREDRLLRLADLLEADANNPKGVKFDLRAWVQRKTDNGFSRYGFTKGETIPISCGTAACAWGLAAISGAFADEGVSFEVSDTGTISPIFDGFDDFDAAEAFFDLTMEEVGYLFDPDYYPRSKLKGSKGELYVAQRVRDLATGKITEDEVMDARP